MLQMPYRELIVTLLRIANGTRPDIAYAVTTLAKYTSNPGEIHWQALLRVLGYLQATLHHCICYTRNGNKGMVLQYRVMLVVYYLLCQIFNVTLMRAMLGMKTHGGALQDTCLRSVVVECKRP